MHNSYYFIRCLSGELKKRIVGDQIVEFFSQDKDDAVILLKSGLCIRCHLTRKFSCLSFPETYNRAKRNSADIFAKVLNKTITDVIQQLNDRSFRIEFDDGCSLLFKLHGNNANLILFKGSKPDALFKNSLRNDLNIDFNQLDRNLDQSYEGFVENGIEDTFPTFDKWIKMYLESEGFGEKDPSLQWSLIEDLLNQLSNNEFFISSINGVTTLSMVPSGDILERFTDPLEAVTRFFQKRISEVGFTDEKQRMQSLIKEKLRKANSYIKKTNSQLEKIREESNYQVLGDNIMANLHSIPKGTQNITLNDVYTGNPITIRLNAKLSPQENAQRFYSKQKNQHIQLETITRSLTEKEQSRDELVSILEEVDMAADFSALRQIKMQSEIFEQKQAEVVRHLPYWEKEERGFRILIGKNAKANDELLRSHSWKEDLWLHAKDVPGSHVLIKHKAGQVFPRPVIERAAQFAAYFSKRRTEDLSPVIYTPRKFVRKRKGDPPGAVVVEKEEIIMVEPAS